MKMTLRAVASLLLATAAAPAQYRSLVAPGDGATLFFSADQPLKSSPGPAQPRIYSIGPAGLELVAEEAAPTLPDETFLPRLSFSGYYALTRNDRSRDGSVSAVTARRDCFGSSLCSTVPLYATIVQSRGRPSRVLSGAGWLSGNGRYLLTDDYLIGTNPVLHDLETGEQWPTRMRSGSVPESTRAIADDGTLAYVFGSRIVIQRRDSFATVPASVLSTTAAINANAATLAYTVEFSGHAEVHLTQLSTQQDTLIFNSGAVSKLAINAGGDRLTFLAASARGDPPQLFSTAVATAVTRAYTDEPSGVSGYALSDDGRTVWYVSGAGALHKIDLDTATTAAVLPPPPVAALTPPDRPAGLLAAGSTAFISLAGVDTQHAAIFFGGIPAPVLQSTPTGIYIQAPWELHDQTVNYETAAPSPSPFSGTFRGRSFLSSWYPEFLRPIHGDWSAEVSSKSPAHPDEVIHFYATGLGPVSPAVATGQPAPSSPLSRTTVAYLCNAEVLFSGLAPGLTGFYQISIRIPQSLPDSVLHLSCTRNGISEVTASIPVSP